MHALPLHCVGPAAAFAAPVPLPPPRREEPALVCLRAGQALVARGDPAAALGAVERALALEPGLAVAHFARAVCLRELGRDAEAEEAFDRALAAEDGAHVVRLHLARALAADDAPAAMRLLAPALQRAPSVREALARDPALAALRDHPVLLQMAGML